jgi:hypothetical protein
MRRWSIVLVLAGAAGLVLAGCGRPAGVDGLLMDDWAPLGQPQVFSPPSGACHSTDFAPTARLSAFSPVDCSASHQLETVHVGTFAGADAERAAPPAAGSADLRTAFGECDTKATGYLGAEWRIGRLWLGVSVPSEAAWTGGARWFRCDMVELSSVEDNGKVVSREASLRGALKDPSPLRLGCYLATLIKAKDIESMPTSDCAKAHNTEFVGTWQAGDIAYPAQDRDWLPFYAGCRSQIASFVGVPDDGDLRYRAGVVTVPAGAQEWQAGNHGVRCYLWLSDRTLTASLRGAGPAALPIKTK